MTATEKLTRRNMRIVGITLVAVVFWLLLSGCVAGQVKYADNPTPPPARIIVEDLAWYEYDQQWFNNGTKPPAWAYILMPLAGLFYR